MRKEIGQRFLFSILFKETLITPASSPQVRFQPYITLDAWRGIACLMVIIYHSALELNGGYPVTSWLGNGALGVQLFFVISGFCIANAADSALRKQQLIPFLIARVRRIFPAYWISLGLILLLKVGISAFGGIQGKSTLASDSLSSSPLYYFSNFALLNYWKWTQSEFISRVAWTLCFEISFYVIVSGALWLALKSNSRDRMLDVMHSLTALCLIGSFFSNSLVPFPLTLWPQFGLGVLVYDFLSASQVPQRKQKVKWLFLLIGALVLALVLRPGLPNMVVEALGDKGFIVALLFSGLLVAAFRYDKTISEFAPVRALAFVGTFSYSLYLVHFPIIMGANRLLHNRLSAWPDTIHLAFLSLVAILASYLFFLVAEKPFLKKVPPSSRKLNVVTDREGKLISSSTS